MSDATSTELKQIFLTMEEYNLSTRCYLGLGFLSSVIISALILIVSVFLAHHDVVSAGFAFVLCGVSVGVLVWVGDRHDTRTQSKRLEHVRGELKRLTARPQGDSN